MSKEKNEEYGDKEAQARFEAALRGALQTPHKPLKEKAEGEEKEESKEKARQIGRAF